MACFELEAGILTRKVDPCIDDDCVVTGELLKRAICVQVQLLELLNDYQDEQVKHDIRDEEDHGNKVSRS